MKLIWILFLTITTELIGQQAQQAQQKEVRVEVNPSTAQVDDSVELSLVLTEKPKETPELPEIKGLHYQFLGQSTSSSWINGQTSYQITLSYSVIADAPGSYTIPSFEVDFQDKKVASNAVTLTFLNQNQAQNPTQNPSQPLEDAPIMIKREVLPAKKQYYVGETLLTITTVFYEDGKVRELSQEQSLSPDFRHVDIKQDESQQMINGKLYHVITLKKALVALKTGSFNLSPYILNAQVVVLDSSQPRRRSLFDFFDQRGRIVQKKYQSNSNNIEVIPLPKPIPADYTGLVGDFSLSTKLTHSEIKVAESATLELKFEGVGAMDAFTAPKFDFDLSFKIYEDKAEFKETPDSAKGLKTSKILRFAIVPTKAGEFMLASKSFSYFDPLSAQYKSLTTDALNLKVTEDPLAQESQIFKANSSSSPTPTAEVKAPALVNLTFIKEIFLALTLIFILFCVVFWVRKKIIKRRQDAFRKFKQKVDLDSFLTYLSERYAIHAHALTSKEIYEFLRAKKVSKDLCDEFLVMLTKMDQLRYGSPQSVDSGVDADLLLKIVTHSHAR